VPHLTIEHSLPADDADIAALVAALHAALIADPMFEVGAIRVRAVACHPVAIADLQADNAFAAMVLRIGAGRTLPDKQRVGAALMQVAEHVLAHRLSSPHFAMSIDIVENDPALSWKVNTIHPRLRAGGTGSR
jgi:5-carboxymethyl-2-hydroxymuconate isomerase